MTITPKEYSDLIQYFSIKKSSKQIISLALSLNETVTEVSLDPLQFNNEWNSTTTTTKLNSSWPHDGYTISFGSPEDAMVTSSTTTIAYYNGALSNDTFNNLTSTRATKPRITTEIPIWLIPCYSIILTFAIVGNLLVTSTLFRNRRMRTITNVFLANLAISDMLLGVLCMPVTLVGTYLRNFIFGELVCKFIQFAQGK